ncbi:hypothetical protein VTK56DRAFT_501 [Thermocarpiscus australiensis]
MTGPILGLLDTRWTSLDYWLNNGCGSRKSSARAVPGNVPEAVADMEGSGYSKLLVSAYCTAAKPVPGIQTTSSKLATNRHEPQRDCSAEAIRYAGEERTRGVLGRRGRKAGNKTYIVYPRKSDDNSCRTVSIRDGSSGLASAQFLAVSENRMWILDKCHDWLSSEEEAHWAEKRCRAGGSWVGHCSLGNQDRDINKSACDF